MIDEQDLYELGDPGSEPPVSCRPVAGVLARGRRLRRRRQALRLAGLATVVATVVGAGLLAGGRPSGEPSTDVAAGPDPTPPSTADVPSAPPPPPPDCLVEAEGAEMLPPNIVPPAEIPDEMRLLPSWTPNDEPITLAQGTVYSAEDSSCPQAWGLVSYDDVLELRATGEDGRTTGLIAVTGPHPWLMADDEASWSEWYMIPGGTEDTTLRGVEAEYSDGDAPDLPRLFAWTEPDGWSWEVRGYGVDEPTLRAVTEALVLDSSPEGEEPLATLDAADVPGGFEVAWQQQGAPEPLPDETTSWTVDVGELATEENPVQTGIRCMVQVDSSSGRPLSPPSAITGSVAATVNGQPAIWTPWGSGELGSPGTHLAWDLTPDIRVRAGCVDWDSEGNRSLPLETVVRFAESIEPVAADDPRLPG